MAVPCREFRPPSASCLRDDASGTVRPHEFRATLEIDIGCGEGSMSPELLDAAHIVPDTEPMGDAVVPNGLSLCKIHHPAYDSHIIGISPEYDVSVRRDILEEIDGPMLRHGLQELEGGRILLPHTAASSIPTASGWRGGSNAFERPGSPERERDRRGKAGAETQKRRKAPDSVTFVNRFCSTGSKPPL